MKLRHTLAGGAALLAALPAIAQIKVNDSLSFTGWATGSYQYTQPNVGTSTDSLNLDYALLQANITPTASPKVSGTISVFYHPSSEGGLSPGGSEATILDAYIAYNCGGGVTVTAGKFLSYLGYESFYSIDDNMISLANQQLLAPIPGYHEGVKLDYSPDKTDTMGFAIVDSLYNKAGTDATEGDGEIDHQGGFEAYYQNTAVNNLTLWFGVGYQTKTMPGVDTSGVVKATGSDIYVGDFWLSYVVDKNNDTIAAEEIWKDGGIDNKGSNWLLYYQQNFTGKISSWFCVSGENENGNPGYDAHYIRYSVAPTYTYNASLSARVQYSYTSYTSYSIKNANYFGAEVLFKF